MPRMIQPVYVFRRDSGTGTLNFGPWYREEDIAIAYAELDALERERSDGGTYGVAEIYGWREESLEADEREE